MLPVRASHSHVPTLGTVIGVRFSVLVSPAISRGVLPSGVMATPRISVLLRIGTGFYLNRPVRSPGVQFGDWRSGRVEEGLAALEQVLADQLGITADHVAAIGRQQLLAQLAVPGRAAMPGETRLEVMQDMQVVVEEDEAPERPGF